MDLMTLLAMNGGNLKLEVTVADLAAFGEAIAEKAINRHQAMMEKISMDAKRHANKVYLNTAQIREKLGVSKSTLWHWAQKGILKPVKIGGQNRYDPDEVQALLGANEKTGNKAD